eukprot:493479_1
MEQYTNIFAIWIFINTLFTKSQVLEDVASHSNARQLLPRRNLTARRLTGDEPTSSPLPKRILFHCIHEDMQGITDKIWKMANGAYSFLEFSAIPSVPYLTCASDEIYPLGGALLYDHDADKCKIILSSFSQNRVFSAGVDVKYQHKRFSDDKQQQNIWIQHFIPLRSRTNDISFAKDDILRQYEVPGGTIPSPWKQIPQLPLFWYAVHKAKQEIKRMRDEQVANSDKQDWEHLQPPHPWRDPDCPYVNELIADCAASFGYGFVVSEFGRRSYLQYQEWAQQEQIHKLPFYQLIQEYGFVTRIEEITSHTQWNIATRMRRWDGAIEFFAWKIFGFVINLMQTRDPLKRFRGLIQRYSTRQLGLLAHTKTLMDVDKLNQASVNKSLKMNEVLHTEHSFNLFMAHCGAEHCTECVLSMIEMVQFKDEVYKKISASGRSSKVSRELNEAFVLPENCPQSDIVFDKNNNFKKIAIALFRKYIAVGSDWEINVDYYTRRRYNTLFGDEDGWMKNEKYDDPVVLYEVFDKCLTEMANLVRAAFTRFKQTESFLILQNKTPTMRGSIPFDLEEESQSK